MIIPLLHTASHIPSAVPGPVPGLGRFCTRNREDEVRIRPDSTHLLRNQETRRRACPLGSIPWTRIDTHSQVENLVNGVNLSRSLKSLKSLKILCGDAHPPVVHLSKSGELVAPVGPRNSGLQ